VPIVLKSGSLNLLEPSGPVKTCNGIALPFYYVKGKCGIPRVEVNEIKKFIKMLKLYLSS
jgi:hypothetical protein